MRILYYTFLFIILTGCSDQSKNNGLSEGSKEATFEGFMSALFLDTLPYKLDCSHYFSYMDISYAVYDKYQPENGYPYAKFQTDTNYTLILYTFPGEQTLPFLYSYDLDGNIIDSIGLFMRACQDDFKSNSNDCGVINADYSIVLTDTTEYFSAVGNVRTLDSAVAASQHYKLNEYGKFELVETRRHQISHQN